jgi:hypothetical protein
MIRRTSMIIVQVSFDFPKCQELAPRYVFPISPDHLNVACRTMMPHKDRKIENPIKNAKIFNTNMINNFNDSDVLLHHAIHNPAEFSL